MKSQTIWLILVLVVVVLGGWMFMKYRKHEAPVMPETAPMAVEAPVMPETAPVTTEAAPAPVATEATPAAEQK